MLCTRSDLSFICDKRFSLLDYISYFKNCEFILGIDFGIVLFCVNFGSCILIGNTLK